MAQTERTQMIRYSYEWIVEKYGEPLSRFSISGDYHSLDMFENDDFPEEILIVSLENKHASGVMIFSRFESCETWQPNYGERYTIKHLMNVNSKRVEEVGKLKKKINYFLEAMKDIRNRIHVSSEQQTEDSLNDAIRESYRR